MCWNGIRAVTFGGVQYVDDLHSVKVQWTLTYPALSYPEYSVIRPQSLRILFNAHAVYGAK